MARVARRTSGVNLRTGRSPVLQSPDNSANVAALGAIGSAVSAAANAVETEENKRTRKREQREDFRVQNDYNKMKLDLDQELADRAEMIDADGDGFHDSFVNDVFKPRRAAFLEGLPPRLKERYDVLLADEDENGQGGGVEAERYSIKAARAERDASYAYAENIINGSKEQLATAISIAPDEYDELLKRGNEQIDSSPLTTLRKKELRADWEKVAQTAHLNTLLDRDPERLLKELGADPRRLSPTTRYDMLENAVIGQESGGDPNARSPKGAIGLMQVMPGTASDIAKELKDPNFPQGGDIAAINEYMERPTVNKRYGRYYLKKMLRRYDGDMEAALVAYNGGPGRADTWLKKGRNDSAIPAETRNYYKTIMRNLPGASNDNTPGAGRNVQFTWVRDGKNEKLSRDDKRLTSTNPDLVNRVASGFAAAGVNDVKIRSAARSKEHNQKVGGASKSQHIHGNALDIDVSGMPIQKRLEALRSLSAQGITGLGIYTNTIHADLGSRRAWGADHSGDSVPKWAADFVAEHKAGTAKGSRVAGRYASMDYDTRQKFINKADTTVTKRYNDSQKATAVQKVEVQDAIRNELAKISATGQGDGIDPGVISNTLGEARYLKYAEQKLTAEQLYTAKDGISTMSPAEMAERRIDYEANPSSENFARQQQVQAGVEKEIERVTRMRKNQPVRAAMEYPEVDAAYQSVNEGMQKGDADPGEVQRFVSLVMGRQADFGIAPEAREPIPQTWALQIGQSLSRVPELSKDVSVADVRTALAAQYTAMQEFFGEYTEEVIIHSLNEYRGVGKNTSELIVAMMESIEAGGDPLKLRRVDQALDQDQVEQNNGDGWYDRIASWWNGDEDDNGDIPPEIQRRVQERLSQAETPADEALLIQRYGKAAVDAARLAAGAN